MFTRFNSILVALLVLALTVPSFALSGAARPVSLTGDLHVIRGVAQFDGEHPFVLTGPLAKAVTACNRMRVSVLGGFALAVPGKSDLPTLDVRRIWTEEMLTGDDVEMVTGSLSREGDGSYSLGRGRFTATGNLAVALKQCAGLPLTVVGRRTGPSTIDVKSIEMDEPRKRSKDEDLTAAAGSGEARANADALGRYAKRFPAFNAEGPDGTYPSIRTVAVDRETGRITIVVETFGGFAAIWLGNAMRFVYTPAGELVSEETLG
jgi:hypothetical protein